MKRNNLKRNLLWERGKEEPNGNLDGELRNAYKEFDQPRVERRRFYSALL